MKWTMQGRIAECVLVAYRTPVAAVEGLLPPGLTLMTHREWAFWNIVACRIEAMRPACCPCWMGKSYHHIGYRLYVNAPAPDGRTSEGLYFVRSDADDAWICAIGNRLTDFRLHRSRIGFSAESDRLHMEVYESENGTGNAKLTVGLGEPKLLRGSCFESYADAQRVLKYRPAALSASDKGKRIKTAQVIRDESKWRETPLRVHEARWDWLDALGQDDVHLEMATRVEPLDYRWRLGNG